MTSDMPFREALPAMLAMVVVLTFVLVYYCLIPCQRALKRRRQEREHGWKNDPRRNANKFIFTPQLHKDFLNDKKYSKLPCSRSSRSGVMESTDLECILPSLPEVTNRTFVMREDNEVTPSLKYLDVYSPADGKLGPEECLQLPQKYPCWTSSSFIEHDTSPRGGKKSLPKVKKAAESATGTPIGQEVGLNQEPQKTSNQSNRASSHIKTESSPLIKCSRASTEAEQSSAEQARSQNEKGGSVIDEEEKKNNKANVQGVTEARGSQDESNKRK